MPFPFVIIIIIKIQQKSTTSSVNIKRPVVVVLKTLKQNIKIVKLDLNMIRLQLVTLGRRRIGRRPLSALSTSASSSRPAPPQTLSSTSNVIRHLSSTTDVTHLPPSSPTARISKDGVVGEPIDFDVGSKIEGNESQVRKVIH